MLSCEVPASASVDTVYVFREALALCDPEVKQAVKKPFQMISDLLGSFVREVSIREIDAEASDVGLTPWLNTFCTLQWADIWSCLGGWIEASKPTLGPRTSKNFELARNLDRRRIGLSVRRKESLPTAAEHISQTARSLVLAHNPGACPCKRNARGQCQNLPGATLLLSPHPFPDLHRRHRALATDNAAPRRRCWCASGYISDCRLRPRRFLAKDRRIVGRNSMSGGAQSPHQKRMPMRDNVNLRDFITEE